MINKKLFLTIIIVISCSIHAIAQTDYYYYKGKKIPLIVNENKICVSIPKDNKDVSDRICANVHVLSKIKDDDLDIFVISRSDYEKLTTQDFWKKDAKSAIVTSNYLTTEKKEVFSFPYLNVRLKSEQDFNLLSSYAERYRLRIIKQELLMPLWYILAVTPESEKNSLECANELFESGDFASSVPDFWSDDLECSNDPLFDQQWGLYNSNNPDIDISVCSAWNYATGKNVNIAILDTGIEMTHMDLASNISSLSYDTETMTSPSHVYDDDGHGTKCAGIAAAIKDNGLQITGVAPEATIISISNKMDTTTCSRIKRAHGITWAYLNGADVISNSWGSSTHHDVIDEAIYNAFIYGRHGKGCVIVFSAGNDNSNHINYPANCNDTILVVGAIDSTGVRAPFSNYGTELDLVAPGVDVFTTFPNNQTWKDSGTSMACPHVAGVAALVLQRNSELTVSQVNSIICSNAKKIPDGYFVVTKPDGSWNNQYGYGLVDAYNAVINTPGDAYIQNETIEGTRIITADSIYVGTDVTDTKPYGDVILGQGDITIKAGYIEINGSTTVPLGTTLTIGE
ncbi:MAG: S8 family serine peptidase [Prevotella sp.]|nr:S8 family serine peptidase [Prevotella sp.]